ncbi:exodeoxyribonuclease VII small subunit [Sporolactobacillus inulinus]|jgi:exodeoxyribonuclease VII small subunit|uniref:Exodeoxyribonuclease 7 small subunit n=2 Tax=Sporolactobacillus inulinus TaxID=2078 RepID=A0A4Y1Z849_9BACL|nr:exodeoxyribonuclease VII small subunit [Sporolactobacillus inulinus]KLI03649.1 exodeoxyribonuclease VII small subunit [Sporolactobacillus inulinus CASD]GAY75174.1 exodeoxyribonuclease VII small subunit [Sporolactobacillus inulinus]GEB76500.1 exodeoxyribonuclease 7 small subunit [Sporolactobacillus inulinus]
MSESFEQDQTKAPAFEDAMDQLDQIVKQLEENDVPLEKAIGLFQEGMALSKICHDKLESVEKKMDQLLTPDGETRPFSVQGDDE